MGPSLLGFPYRCNTSDERTSEALDFCLMMFGPSFSASAELLEKIRDGAKVKENTPCWYYKRKRSLVKFFFLKHSDLLRFTLTFGIEPGYEVDRTQLQDSAS